MADTDLTTVDNKVPPPADKTTTTAKNGVRERPISTRSGDAAPVFETPDSDAMDRQRNGNTKDLAKPAPTPTHATAVNMLMTSWAEMKMKFADFDHDLNMEDPAEAELQGVIDFLRQRI